MELVSAKVRTFGFLSLPSPEPAADSKPSPFSALYRTLGRQLKLESPEDIHEASARLNIVNSTAHWRRIRNCSGHQDIDCS
jgi:hypothetical protein